MGHNYAKPATAEQRLTRVLSRIPSDWAVMIERRPGTGMWRAAVHPGGQDGLWSEETAQPVEALESAWRLNRPPAS
ncbi:hypothetical protein [Acetobacter oeni]|uniref:Uncharacterized protein n=1 Tax=Acetobacter oeni TaxID=304077 RepID=A0A511XMG2_9PROT|nr:hypothetical protein [Acetobacter oeni]MBB3883665.1 hypothetical protein [Acetobacter oeni]NHO19752.1 hypothetical protein [Acetobacter oeni]GBR02929.1 hypothetical protein AA21952_0906 [Acetobacter oeni LMG 21952]GEN64134.1 hypothetical protein AOE01nite_23580 [Acetobacter oeni]